MVIYKKYEYDVCNRKYFGEAEKAKRICRFCNRGVPDVTFRYKAHAISESIGNKYLINREECDKCNSKFNPIEQEFYNYHSFSLLYCNQKGKDGNRKIKGKDLSIYNQNGILVIETRSENQYEFSNNDKTIMNVETDVIYESYVPQNIYKCLCKYVIGVLETKFIRFFKGTIDWINSELFPADLPPVLSYTPNCILDHPRIAYFIRLKENQNVPFAIGCLEFADKGYFYIIPFCKGYTRISPTIYQNFILAFHKILGNRSYRETYLNDTQKQMPPFKMEIHNIILGETAFVKDLC